MLVFMKCIHVPMISHQMDSSFDVGGRSSEVDVEVAAAAETFLFAACGAPCVDELPTQPFSSAQSRDCQTVSSVEE